MPARGTPNSCQCGCRVSGRQMLRACPAWHALQGARARFPTPASRCVGSHPGRAGHGRARPAAQVLSVMTTTQGSARPRRRPSCSSSPHRRWNATRLAHRAPHGPGAAGHGAPGRPRAAAPLLPPARRAPRAPGPARQPAPAAGARPPRARPAAGRARRGPPGGVAPHLRLLLTGPGRALPAARHAGVGAWRAAAAPRSGPGGGGRREPGGRGASARPAGVWRGCSSGLLDAAGVRVGVDGATGAEAAAGGGAQAARRGVVQEVRLWLVPCQSRARGEKVACGWPLRRVSVARGGGLCAGTASSSTWTARPTTASRSPGHLTGRPWSRWRRCGRELALLGGPGAP